MSKNDELRLYLTNTLNDANEKLSMLERLAIAADSNLKWYTYQERVRLCSEILEMLGD